MKNVKNQFWFDCQVSSFIKSFQCWVSIKEEKYGADWFKSE